MSTNCSTSFASITLSTHNVDNNRRIMNCYRSWKNKNLRFYPNTICKQHLFNINIQHTCSTQSFNITLSTHNVWVNRRIMNCTTSQFYKNSKFYPDTICKQYSLTSCQHQYQHLRSTIIDQHNYQHYCQIISLTFCNQQCYQQSLQTTLSTNYSTSIASIRCSTHNVNINRRIMNCTRSCNQ